MAPEVDLLQWRQIMNEMNASLAANANVAYFANWLSPTYKLGTNE